MYLKLAIIAFGLISLSVSAPIKPNEKEAAKANAAPVRCFPDEGQGVLWQAIAYYDDASKTPGYLEQDMTYAWNYPKKLGAGKGYASKGQIATFVQDFNKLIQYTIIDGKCFKSQLPDGAFVQCLPDQYKFNRTIYQGAGDNKLNMNVFHMSVPGVVNGTMVLTETGVPVSNIQRINQSGFHQFMNLVYNNVVLKVPDPSIFDVPDICNQVQQEEDKDIFVKTAGSIHQRHQNK